MKASFCPPWISRLLHNLISHWWDHWAMPVGSLSTQESSTHSRATSYLRLLGSGKIGGTSRALATMSNNCWILNSTIRVIWQKTPFAFLRGPPLAFGFGCLNSSAFDSQLRKTFFEQSSVLSIHHARSHFINTFKTFFVDLHDATGPFMTMLIIGQALGSTHSRAPTSLRTRMNLVEDPGSLLFCRSRPRRVTFQDSHSDSQDGAFMVLLAFPLCA